MQKCPFKIGVQNSPHVMKLVYVVKEYSVGGPDIFMHKSLRVTLITRFTLF